MSLNLAEVFSAVAAAVHDPEALICGGERCTSAGLETGSNQFAHDLLGSVVEPGDQVGLY